MHTLYGVTANGFGRLQNFEVQQTRCYNGSKLTTTRSAGSVSI